MRVSLYGYSSGYSGTEIYARELHNQLEQTSISLHHREPATVLRPKALNQILLNRFNMSKGDDVLHMTNQDDLASIGFPSRNRLVVTVHDLFRLTEGSRPLDGWRSHKIVENLSEADAVIAISEFAKQQVVEHTELNREDVYVVYQGVDRSKFYPDNGSGFNNFFVHVGSTLGRKNLEGLFDTFALIRNQQPDTRLVRVGGKDETCHRKLDEYGLVEGQDVHFVKNLPASKLRCLYSDAKALLFPSKKEGFGRPIIEAAACGTQPIAFDTKPMNEVLPDRLLAKPFDSKDLAETALQETRSNPEKIAEKFDWEETAKDTVKVYKEVTGN